MRVGFIELMFWKDILRTTRQCYIVTNTLCSYQVTEDKVSLIVISIQCHRRSYRLTSSSWDMFHLPVETQEVVLKWGNELTNEINLCPV